MSLVRAEARRLVKRRFTRWMLALMVVFLGVIIGSMSLASKEHTPEVRAQAQVQAQAYFQEELSFHRQMVAECEAAKGRGEDITQRFPPDCGKSTPPTADQINPEDFLPFEFVFRELFETFIAVFFGILALFAYLVGASFIGAEWNTGGMTNLLLWRPRRLTVLSTKLGVLLGAVLVTGVVLGAVWTLALWLIGSWDGRTGPMSAGAWQSFALTGLRGLGLALVVAAIGFGLASIGRHTALALGVALAMAVGVETGMAIGLDIASVAYPGRFVLSTYVIAWFLKEHTLRNFDSCNVDPTGQCQPAELVVTWQHSALVFGVATALVLGAALWTMRNRDVT